MPGATTVKLVVTTLTRSQKVKGFSRVAYVTKPLSRGVGQSTIEQVLQQSVKSGEGQWYDGTFFRKREDEDVFDVMAEEQDDSDDDELAAAELSPLVQLDSLVQLQTKDVAEQLMLIFAGVRAFSACCAMSCNLLMLPCCSEQTWRAARSLGASNATRADPLRKSSTLVYPMSGV